MPHIRQAAAALFCTAVLFSGCMRQNMSQQDLELQMMEQSTASVVSSAPMQEPSVLRLPVLDEGNRNPFSSAGITPSITPLLYQSLYLLDENYHPKPQLAQAISYGEGNTVCTVTLRSGILFSDGSAVTPKDAAASLREALKYPSAFPELAAAVAGCTATEDALIITLTQADRCFTSLLTFPICKAGTQSDELPTGSGPFVCGTSKATRLRRNEYYEDPAFAIESVELIPVSERESLEYMLKIGVIDFYSSPDASMDSHSYGSSEYPTLNRLTFIGINRQNNALLASDELLHAVFSVINKEQLVSYACGNTAQAADIPFHPGYWEQENITQPEQDGTAAAQDPELEEILQQYGYTEKDEEGYWIRQYRSMPYRLSLDILINSENTSRQRMAELMQEQLAEVGIELNIVSKAYSDYLQAVAYRQYDFYIGEVSIGDNMDLSHLFTEETAAYLGFPYDPELLDVAIRLKNGQAGYAEFLEIFQSKGIMEPLCYKRGSISYSRNLTADFIERYRDLLFQIQWY